MSKSSKLLLALGVILALGATSLALANYPFEGFGTGTSLPGTSTIPFVVWEGTLINSSTPYFFTGSWGGDYTNVIHAYLNYIQQTGVYQVIVDPEKVNNYWCYNWTPYGQWAGSFYPPTPNDYAGGVWWVYPPDSSSLHGTWWGDRADD